MNNDVTLLLTEDDPGHLKLLINNLRRSGIQNKIMTFTDGHEVLDFLLNNSNGPLRNASDNYLLMLDIKMPKVNGIEVLSKIKNNDELRLMPVIMLTTTDDPKEIEKCYSLGCNTYIVKPVDHNNFSTAINNLGLFLKVIEVPGCSCIYSREN